ncbi:MAG: hypothetical protein OWU84_05065 [Firmicutes bacterium]|nr:hypothetical protein [Bacillota bacterium]
MIVRKSVSLASAALLASLGLAAGLTPLASAQTMMTLTASATDVTAGTPVTFTVHDPNATANTEFELGIMNQLGHTWWTGYGTSPAITLNHLTPGAYVVTGWALSRSLVQAHKWGMAQPTAADVLYVGSTVSLNVTTSQENGETLATVEVSSTGINNPVYALAWQMPNGQWTTNNAFQESPTFTVPLPMAGTYQFVAYAAPYGAPMNVADALKSAPVSLAVSVPAAGVTLTPATGALRADSQGLDPVTVTVTNAWGQPLSTFSGSVTVSDTAGQLVAANSTSPTSTLVVPIVNGTGTFSVLAQNSAGIDQITASNLMANPGSAVLPNVSYGSTSIATRASGGNISTLNTIEPVASTVDAQNGDQNPYGLVIDTYAGTPTAPNPFYGDLLVSNFSNSQGVNGAGTTIEAINPNTGAVTRFSADADGPVALAVSPKGPLWIANFGTNGTNGNDMVLTPAGSLFPNGGSVIQSPLFDGPWGQVFVPNQTAPAFLVTNALNGTIDAMYDFAPPNFNTDTQVSVIGQGLAHMGTNASNVEGPQGMVYDPNTHMVYVTDAADNSIRAFYWNGPGTPNQGQGQLIYQGGALNKPAGITLDPLNGDLLVVNQGNNNLVEIALNNGHAYVAGQKVLDSTPVNPETGAGSALFGVTATVSNGQLLVYFTDDNTNTVDVLK